MKTLRALPALALLALLGCCLVGCHTSYQKAGVAVVLESVTVRDDNTALLQVKLQNENIVAVAVATTRFRTTLGGVGYGEALGAKPVALMELGTAQQEAVLPLGSPAAAARLKAALAAGPLAYTLDCRLICESGDEQVILTTVASGHVAGR